MPWLEWAAARPRRRPGRRGSPCGPARWRRPRAGGPACAARGLAAPGRRPSRAGAARESSSAVLMALTLVVTRFLTRASPTVAAMSPSAPAPGQAAMPAPDAPSLLRRNATDPDLADRPAVRFGDRIWTHAEFAAESMRWANLLLAHRPTDPGGRDRSTDPRRGPVGQHPGLPVRPRRCRLRRRHGGGAQPDPGGRAPAARHRPHRRRPHPDRAGPSRRPGRARPGRSTRAGLPPLRRVRTAPAGAGDQDLEAALAEVSRRRPPRGGGADRPLGADLHLGHVGRAQGGDLHPASAAGHRQPDDHHARASAPTTWATWPCPCSTPTR